MIRSRGASTFAVASTIVALLALSIGGCGGGEGDGNGATATVRCTDPPRESFDPETIVGQALPAASAAAEARGCTVREAIRDGEHLALTSDFVPDRVNVATEDGTVIGIAGIY